MSVEALAVVLHHSRAKGTAKLVLLGIANHSGDGGAWPSMDTLGRYANVDRSNVKRALKTLQSLGEVRVHVQAGGLSDADDGRRPNRYDVLVSCPQWCDRTTAHRDTRRRDVWQTLPVDKGGADSPPVPERGGASAPRTGGAGAPLTVPLNQPPLSSPLTTDRARGGTCAICSLDQARCESIPGPVSGHIYTPKADTA